MKKKSLPTFSSSALRSPFLEFISIIKIEELERKTCLGKQHGGESITYAFRASAWTHLATRTHKTLFYLLILASIYNGVDRENLPLNFSLFVTKAICERIKLLLRAW